MDIGLAVPRILHLTRKHLESEYSDTNLKIDEWPQYVKLLALIGCLLLILLCLLCVLFRLERRLEKRHAKG